MKLIKRIGNKYNYKNVLGLYEALLNSYFFCKGKGAKQQFCLAVVELV